MDRQIVARRRQLLGLLDYCIRVFMTQKNERNFCHFVINYRHIEMLDVLSYMHCALKKQAFFAFTRKKLSIKRMAATVRTLE